MPPLIRAFSRRDAVLILVGAFLMHFLATMVPLTSRSVINTTRFHQQVNEDLSINIDEAPPHSDQELTGLLVPIPSELDTQLGQGTASQSNDLSRLGSLPETTIIEHVPGWTLFRDIYMANGTLFILTSSPSSIPGIRYMTSTGLTAEDTPENKNSVNLPHGT
ncbi:hypothetical protein JVU11DRAFT_2737 [Chiua virens]|nr:hypothetical protein JVU11DRAFT_2737 [Chiua virens]